MKPFAPSWGEDLAMKIEFLPNGSSDCPLIRIYDFDRTAACQLQDVILSFVSHGTRSFAFHELPFMESVGDCCLIGKLGNHEEGVFADAKNPNSFVWILAEEGWKDVTGLIEPFCKSDANGFQWLNCRKGIPVLFSPTGKW
jgi:hypothetical protein